MDNLTIEQRKRNMQNIRSENTKPELRLRKKLWNKGIRYRIHGKKIFGRPDIYLKGRKIAIFVDSDFWHGRLYQEGKSIPKSNQDYWISKLERNIARDKLVNEILIAQGWRILRFWETEVTKELDKCVTIITNTINQTS
ncbi:MAG: very short patch repair endonuclease [Gammaproteobacteria bacterium]|nr:very short patch repair endonuclease [Gammaproteobacteria bacterium]